VALRDLSNGPGELQIQRVASPATNLDPGTSPPNPLHTLSRSHCAPLRSCAALASLALSCVGRFAPPTPNCIGLEVRRERGGVVRTRPFLSSSFSYWGDVGGPCEPTDPKSSLTAPAAVCCRSRSNENAGFSPNQCVREMRPRCPGVLVPALRDLPTCRGPDRRRESRGVIDQLTRRLPVVQATPAEVLDETKCG